MSELPQIDLYQPLDASQRQIRLIHLQPGEDVDPILLFHFHVESLNDNLEYVALSYVWGDTAERCTIHVYKDDQRATISIARNLHSILHSLRHPRQPRTLWVDALCINQDNLNEKSSQIGIMQDVYKQARQVWVYLGDYWDGCERAVEGILELARGKHLTSDRENGLSIGGAGLESVELLQCLIRYLDTPWLQRTWTLQEHVLAKDILLLCGHIGITGETLAWMLKNVTMHEAGCCFGWRKSLSVTHAVDWLRTQQMWDRLRLVKERMEESQANKDQSFFLTMELCRHRKASDPHDKVYGVLGLAPTEWANLIHPDYTLPYQEVFQQAAMVEARVTERVNFLSFCSPAEAPGLPSWVPDWRTDGDKWLGYYIRMKFSAWYAASGTRAVDMTVLSGRRLQVGGVQVGSIAACCTPYHHEVFAPRADTIQLISEIRSLIKIDEKAAERYGATDQSIETAYYLSLTCGWSMPLIRPKGETYFLLTNVVDEYLRRLEDIQLGRDPSGDAQENDSMVTCFTQNVNFRRFVQLDNGYFGWAAETCCLDDVVVALGGGSMLYVLRRLPGGEYTYVGDAYIHGMMGGEAFEVKEQLEQFIIV